MIRVELSSTHTHTQPGHENFKCIANYIINSKLCQKKSELMYRQRKWTNKRKRILSFVGICIYLHGIIDEITTEILSIVCYWIKCHSYRYIICDGFSDIFSWNWARRSMLWNQIEMKYHLMQLKEMNKIWNLRVKKREWIFSMLRKIQHKTRAWYEPMKHVRLAKQMLLIDSNE